MFIACASSHLLLLAGVSHDPAAEGPTKPLQSSAYNHLLIGRWTTSLHSLKTPIDTDIY